MADFRRLDIHSMGSISAFVELIDVEDELRREWKRERGRQPSTGNEMLEFQWEALERQEGRGPMPMSWFNGLLFNYLNQSIEEILASKSVLTRALGMFDRRLGKRRLRALDVSEDHPLVQKFHCLRREWEGIYRQ